MLAPIRSNSHLDWGVYPDRPGSLDLEAVLPVDQMQMARLRGGPVPAEAVAPLSDEDQVRQIIRQVEKAIGRPLEIGTEKALKAYVESLRGLPPDQYDRRGFLNWLGQADLKTSGRGRDQHLHAVRATSFLPDNELLGMKIGPQQFFFKMAKNNPQAFYAISLVTDFFIEGPTKLKGKYREPFQIKQKPVPTGETPEERYGRVLTRKFTRAGEMGIKFGGDFHSGVPPKGVTEPTQGYGTYSIARLMGFTDAQARRLGEMDYGVDENITPYGKTSPSPFDQEDRHFNFNRKGQDTRLLWAKRHLYAALELAHQGAYDQAEIELGVGLHSLQDLFAHGQLNPSTHATLGRFPDSVTTNPMAVYEASEATASYLRTYLNLLLAGVRPPKGWEQEI